MRDLDIALNKAKELIDDREMLKDELKANQKANCHITCGKYKVSIKVEVLEGVV